MGNNRGLGPAAPAAGGVFSIGYRQRDLVSNPAPEGATYQPEMAQALPDRDEALAWPHFGGAAQQEDLGGNAHRLRQNALEKV
jgi:hypothetical protein